MSHRRTAQRSSPAKPLDPKDFVQRLAAGLGTDSVKPLVKHVFRIVENSGQPNRWIFEVKRARERGALSPEVAHFLIYKLAETAMTPLTVTHPVLSRLDAKIERIEREHGLEEGEYWHVHEGPPEWQALDHESGAVFDELLMDILPTQWQREIAEAHAAGDEGVFMAGRALVFGELDADVVRPEREGMGNRERGDAT